MISSMKLRERAGSRPLLPEPGFAFTMSSSTSVRVPCDDVFAVGRSGGSGHRPSPRRQLFPARGKHDMSVTVQFDIADGHVAMSAAKPDRNEPVLRGSVKRRIPGPGHMPNVVEQKVAGTGHGVHTRTPRKPAVAQAAREVSKFHPTIGPLRGVVVGHLV